MGDHTHSNNKISHAAIQRREPTERVMPIVIALPFTVLEYIGRACFYSTWYLLYFVACAFRAFTSAMLVTAVIMLPMALGVFVNPSVAPMPWWFFLLSALGMFAFAVGYNLFLDWFAPPGTEDPFDRYRAKTGRKP